MGWCRACGSEPSANDALARSCWQCGVALEGPSVASSRVGLVYDYRRKIFKKKAVCIGDLGDQLRLHVSAKEPAVVVTAANAGEPDTAGPEGLKEYSPAGRLVVIARDLANNKSDWDGNSLMAAAMEQVQSSVGAQRLLATETLRSGWEAVFDALPLSASEKCWTRAHHLAASGNALDLPGALEGLPEHGYNERVGLLLPYLSQIASAPGTWRPLLDRWVEADLPGARDVRDVAWPPDFHRACDAGLAVLGKVADEKSSRAWREALELLDKGQPSEPLGPGSKLWAIAALYTRGCAGFVIDERFTELATLARPLLDDLIDAQALTSAVDDKSVAPEDRLHFLARLDPTRLSDDELRAVGHGAELARRCFLERDRVGLEKLTADAGALHYGALLDLLDGKGMDRERLRPDAAYTLQIAHDYKTVLDAGTPSAPPPEVLADPSLWSLIEPHARTGLALLRPDDRARFPEFAQWYDLQRTLGLLWEEEWEQAAQRGVELSRAGSRETITDEAASLAAFALHQLRQNSQAMEILDQAMEGLYTEALLVNATIIAAAVDPTHSVTIFARLVRDAPTAELKLAALRRAVDVLDTGITGQPFPKELLEPLKDALSTGACQLSDYCRFMWIAVSVMPQAVVALPRPSGPTKGPYLFGVALARFNSDPNFFQTHLAKALIAVFHEVGRPDWFEVQWRQLLEGVKAATFVDFGEATGEAAFWDTVGLEAPELLTTFERLVFLPQAGAHKAAHFAKSNNILSGEAFKKFFYVPAEEFLVSGSSFDEGVARMIASNLAQTLSMSTLWFAQVSRNQTTDRYNPLVQRLRWDTENRYEIVREMRSILDEDTASVDEIDRALDRIRRLPLDEAERRTRQGPLEDILRDWRAEIVKLRSNL